MNKLSIEARAQIIKCLVEGNSIRSTCRQTGAAKGTVTRLLVEVGTAASLYQNDVLRNLPCTRIEADEIWSFVGAKEGRKTNPAHGDLWTFTAICADTKLAVTWLVGPRSSQSTHYFMQDLASRLARRVQLSTDQLMWYVAAVEGAFGWNGCDFGQIAKKNRDMQHNELLNDGSLTPDVIASLFAAAKHCPYCANTMLSEDKSLDHIWPRRSGGWHSVTNVLVCCKRCNARKHGRTPDQWLGKLDEVRRPEVERLYQRITRGMQPWLVA